METLGQWAQPEVVPKPTPSMFSIHVHLEMQCHLACVEPKMSGTLNVWSLACMGPNVFILETVDVEMKNHDVILKKLESCCTLFQFLRCELHVPFQKGFSRMFHARR